MELEGRISVVMPVNSGVSQRNGNSWKSQEFILEYFWFPNQVEPSHMVMRVFGEEKIKKFNLQPNDNVKVRFHIEAHEYNGRWYNESAQVSGVTFVGSSAGKNNPAANATGTVAQQQPTATDTGAQQPTSDATDTPAEAQQEESDDLPF
jgi:hypothetical protein